MPDDNWTWRLEEVIPSDAAAARRLLDCVLGRLELDRWPQRDLFSVHLALEEALVNAIRHGNKSDHSKQVHVVCRLSWDLVQLEIRDEGSGFLPADVPDCTGPENLEKPSGRGLLLMQTFMSSVQFSPEGNCVVMEKRRTVLE